jgi:predicted Zn-dependent protease
MAAHTIEAFLFHPDHGNEMVPGLISADRNALHFFSDDLNIEIPLERVVIRCESKRDRRLSLRDRRFPDIVLFTVDDSIFSDPVLTQYRQTRAQLTEIAGRFDSSARWKMTLYALAACVVLVWIGSYVYRAAIKSVVSQIPSEWEKKIGDEEIVKVREEMEFIDNTNCTMELAKLAAPLVRGIPGEPIELKFYLVADSMPNAAALPGGHVLVTTGLLELVDRPEQLLGVIAHELAHVKRRHGFQQVISAGGPVLVMQILMSGRDNRLSLMGQISGFVIVQSFSKNFEREADETGWDYMVAANIDPRGMIEALELLQSEVGEMPFIPEKLESHPALQKRINKLKSKWEELPHKTGFIVLTNQIPSAPTGNSPHKPSFLRRRPGQR